jgi:maltose O-acetyltransferase
LLGRKRLSPIEIVSIKGSNISIGDHTFINYGTSITAYQQVRIGRHCLLGHHVRILDKNEHGIKNEMWRRRPHQLSLKIMYGLALTR